MLNWWFGKAAVLGRGWGLVITLVALALFIVVGPLQAVQRTGTGSFPNSGFSAPYKLTPPPVNAKAQPAQEDIEPVDVAHCLSGDLWSCVSVLVDAATPANNAGGFPNSGMPATSGGCPTPGSGCGAGGGGGGGFLKASNQ